MNLDEKYKIAMTYPGATGKPYQGVIFDNEALAHIFANEEGLTQYKVTPLAASDIRGAMMDVATRIEDHLRKTFEKHHEEEVRKSLMGHTEAIMVVGSGKVSKRAMAIIGHCDFGSGLTLGKDLPVTPRIEVPEMRAENSNFIPEKGSKYHK